MAPVIRTQIDKQLPEFLRIIAVLEQVLQQFLLPGLSQRQPVHGQDLDQPLIPWVSSLFLRLANCVFTGCFCLIQRCISPNN